MRRLLALLLVAASGCTTVTSPVLRHETGEVLGGFKHFRVYGHIEQARLLPAFGSASAAAGVPQEKDVFQGTLIGLQGIAGLTPKLDAQIGGFLGQGGGGWRIGGKYQWRGQPKAEKWSMAAMFGYGRGSGKGTLIYKTMSYDLVLDQTLAVKTYDLSVPVSYRFSKTFAMYSGLLYFHTILAGSSGPDFVSYVANDLGMNLGLRFSFGIIEADLEGAMIHLYDPFKDEIRYVPYYGLSAGIAF